MSFSQILILLLAIVITHGMRASKQSATSQTYQRFLPIWPEAIMTEGIPWQGFFSTQVLERCVGQSIAAFFKRGHGPMTSRPARESLQPIQTNVLPPWIFLLPIAKGILGGVFETCRPMSAPYRGNDSDFYPVALQELYRLRSKVKGICQFQEDGLKTSLHS